MSVNTMNEREECALIVLRTAEAECKQSQGEVGRIVAEGMMELARRMLANMGFSPKEIERLRTDRRQLSDLMD